MNFSMNPSIQDFLDVAYNMREDEVEQYLSIVGKDKYVPEEFVKTMLQYMSEITFVLYDNDGVACCIGGLVETRQKVWQTWMMGTQEGWDNHWRSITKLSRRVIDDLLNSNMGHRVHCYSLHSRHKTHEWYRRGLGMDFESINHKFFADGQNAACHVKIKE